MNKIIAGHAAAAIVQAEHEAIALAHPSATRVGCIDSEALCAWQQKVARRGFCEAELVQSLYGYSVRYASGLNNFSILAGARQRQVDGTLEDATRWAENWVSQDPDHRYVTIAAHNERVAV